MTATLSSVRAQQRERHLSYPVAIDDDVRVAFVDRLSLRIGIWLLLRSTRNIDRAHDHATRARTLANSRACEARERHALREHLLRTIRA